MTIPKTDQQGFTVIELCVAMLLMTIGIFAVITMQTTALNSNAIANSISVATALAQEAMEDMMALGETDPRLTATASNVTYDLDPKTSATSVSIPGAGTYTATYSTTINTPDTGVTRIVVVVTGGGRTVTLTCYKRLT